MKRITLDDLPPKYREQAERQMMEEELVKWRKTAVSEIGEYIARNPTVIHKYLHPEEQDVQTGKESLPVRKDRKPKGPNKTEQRFNREVLGGEGRYEAITLRLPGGSRYTPDFLTALFDPLTHQYDTHVYEVKGTYRLGSHGRALTAFREARSAFPFLSFHWYERQKDGTWMEKYTK